MALGSPRWQEELSRGSIWPMLSVPAAHQRGNLMTDLLRAAAICRSPSSQADSSVRNHSSATKVMRVPSGSETVFDRGGRTDPPVSIDAASGVCMPPPIIAGPAGGAAVSLSAIGRVGERKRGISVRVSYSWRPGRRRSATDRVVLSARLSCISGSVSSENSPEMSLTSRDAGPLLAAPRTDTDRTAFSKLKVVIRIPSFVGLCKITISGPVSTARRRFAPMLFALSMRGVREPWAGYVERQSGAVPVAEYEEVEAGKRSDRPSLRQHWQRAAPTEQPW